MQKKIDYTDLSISKINFDKEKERKFEKKNKRKNIHHQVNYNTNKSYSTMKHFEKINNELYVSFNKQNAEKLNNYIYDNEFLNDPQLQLQMNGNALNYKNRNNSKGKRSGNFRRKNFEYFHNSVKIQKEKEQENREQFIIYNNKRINLLRNFDSSIGKYSDFFNKSNRDFNYTFNSNNNINNNLIFRSSSANNYNDRR